MAHRISTLRVTLELLSSRLSTADTPTSPWRLLSRPGMVASNANGRCTATISRNGDLVHRMYLEVTGKSGWNHY